MCACASVGSHRRREPLTRALFLWALATAGAAPACGSVRADEALALLDVSAAADVPAFATLCLSVTARPEIPTFEVLAPPTRQQKVGYYLPGPSGSVQVRAQAVASSGAVVGEGVAAVDVALGRVSPVVSLTIGGGTTSASLCRRRDAGADGPSDAATDGRADVPPDAPTTDGGADRPADGSAAADARTDATVDATTDTTSDASSQDGDTGDRSDSGGGCTGCTPGESKTESAPCSPCSSGRWSRTVTCSPTCTWVAGAWGACSDQGGGEHGCSVVDWCTRAAAPECRQVACSGEQALAECRAEAKEICGQSSPSPTLSYCN